MEDPPEDGRSAEQVFEQAARQILPFAARIDHPRFFGFIPSSPTWLGILADFMVAGFHVNQCTWLTSSGPSQLELVVIDWFRRWLGYPENAGGIFTSGGSAASVDAFVAAREAAGRPERATVYMSDQSHSAFSRAALVVGVRRECIRIVPSDEAFDWTWRRWHRQWQLTGRRDSIHWLYAPMPAQPVPGRWILWT